MADEQESGSDVAVEIAGQKVNLKNVKSLNTLATFATLVIVCLSSYMVFVHAGDAKDNAKEIAKELKESNKEVSNALKESNRELGIILRNLDQGIREQNCLSIRIKPDSTPQQRLEEAEFCKRLTR